MCGMTGIGLLYLLEEIRLAVLMQIAENCDYLPHRNEWEIFDPIQIPHTSTYEQNYKFKRFSRQWTVLDWLDIFL